MNIKEGDEAMTNRRHKMSVRRAANLVSVTLLSLVLSNAVSTAQDKHAEQNYQPGVPYSISDIESINNTNGNLMFNFGFGMVTGRGRATQGISLKYNSKLYETHTMTALDMGGNNNPQIFIRKDLESGWQYDQDYRIRVINRNDDLDQPIQPGGGFIFLPPEQGDGCVHLPPNYKAVYVWKLIMYFPDGSQHEFRPTGYSDESQDQLGSLQTKDGYFNVDTSGTIKNLAYALTEPNGDCSGTPYSVSVVTTQDPNSKMTYYSTDGTFMRLEIPNGQDVRNPANWTLYMPDGSRVTTGELDAQGNPLPQRVYDKNGNFVTKGTVTLPDGGGTQVEGYVDEVGRYVARKQVSPLEDHIYKIGVSGEPVIWKVKWKWISVIKKYTTSGTIDEQRCCYSQQVHASQHKVVDEVILPEEMGDLKYKFTYNGHEGQVNWNGDLNNPNESPGWGDVIDVTTPSGAKAEYDYALPVGFGAVAILPKMGKVTNKKLIYDISYDGTSQSVTEDWLYDINFNSATITGPDGGVTTQYFFSTETDNDLSGRVYRDLFPDGRIVERIWANNKVGGCPAYGCGSMRRLNTYVKTEFTTLPDSAGNPSLTAIKDFEYDKNGNVTKVTEYDWVPYSSIPHAQTGPPVVTGIPSGLTPSRITENNYHNQTETASNSTANNPASYWNASAPNVRNAVGSTEIKNSAGTPVSRAEFEYDNYSTTANLLATRSWDSFKGGQYQAYSDPLTSTNSITTSATYNQYGMPLTTTDANGVVTTITYGCIDGSTSSPCPIDAPDNLYPTKTEVASNYPALKRTSSAKCDFYTGLVTTATDVDNSISAVTEYDALGRPTKVRNAAGTTLESWTRTEYDDVNRRVIVRSDIETVGDGRKVAIQHFDQLGRVRLARTLENPLIEDPTNEQHGIKVQTRYKYAPGYTYQLASNPYRAVYPANESDATMGWTLSTAWSNGRRSEVQTFAGAGLPTAFGGSNTNSTGIVRTDIDANATTVTDQAGKLRRSISNALGQLTRVDEPNTNNEIGTVAGPNQPTHYYYNTLGKMVHVEQGMQHRYFMYDSLGRLLRVRQPEQGVNTALDTTGNPDNNNWTAGFTYDNNGNAVTATDAKNVTIANTYDALNRVTQRSYNDTPQTPTVTFAYDDQSIPRAKGKLTKVTSSVSESRYVEFDEAGRLKQFQQYTDGQTYTSKYTYNLSGALVEEEYPSGRVVQNEFDQNGDLQRIFGNATPTATERTYANSFSYSPDGKIERLKLGNGLWEAANSNSRLQVTEFALGHGPTSGDLWKLNVDYGELQTNGTVDATKNSGNIGKQTLTFNGLANPFVQTFQYDPLYRLTEAKETNNGNQTWRQVFGYDRYGNRTSHEKWLGTTQQTLTTEEHPDIDPDTNRFESTEGFTFDANGNVVVDAQGRQFTFNGDNKQTEVRDDQNNVIGEYFYDGEGKRIKKVVGAHTTIFVYSGSKLIAEYSTETPPANPTTRYTITDQLGSPRVIVDALGQVISRRDFLPFGEEIEPDGTYRTTAQKYGQTDGVRQKFTGYQNDEETGLDFAEARMYQNLHGRFTAIDPLLASGKSADPQTFNRYVYVLNNPLVLTDPSGLQSGQTPDKKSGFCILSCNFVDKPYERIPLGEGETASSFDTDRAANIRTDDAIGVFLSGFSYGISESQYGAAITVPNIGIGLWNFSTDLAFRGQYNFSPGLPNPFAVEPYPITSGTAARMTVGLNVGLAFAPTAAAAPFAAGSSLSVFPQASRIANPIPSTMARVIPGEGSFSTLGRAGEVDVFVTAADDIAGMTAAQIGPRLQIPRSDVFTVIEFPTPPSGVASPVFRSDPGFVGFGRTTGGAREFVIPNGQVPCNATVRKVC